MTIVTNYEYRYKYMVRRRYLLKGDKMSMASSIELRVPFLDKEVFEVARYLRLDQK
ncbi:asparagine synthase-related protein [Paraclostridium bifermentans]|nr:asparagine synthase-related protein [Paraclostridium bifermentans]